MRAVTGGYVPPGDACNSYRALLDGLFLLLSVILAAAGERSRDQQYLVNLHRSLVLPILLPFVCLLFATEAFGGEIED